MSTLPVLLMLLATLSATLILRQRLLVRGWDTYARVVAAMCAAGLGAQAAAAALHLNAGWFSLPVGVAVAALYVFTLSTWTRLRA